MTSNTVYGETAYNYTAALTNLTRSLYSFTTSFYISSATTTATLKKNTFKNLIGNQKGGVF